MPLTLVSSNAPLFRKFLLFDFWLLVSIQLRVVEIWPQLLHHLILLVLKLLVVSVLVIAILQVVHVMGQVWLVSPQLIQRQDLVKATCGFRARQVGMSF